MSTHVYDDALADLGSMISDDVLAALGEFDGSATILVPNQTETYDLTKTYEGPQIIQFGETQLQTFPTRISWDLRVTSTSMRHTDAVTKANRKDWNMVLVGERKCQVFLGNHWISDAEFCALLIKKASKDNRSVENIVAALAQRGLSLNGSMPMYLQHLGADEDRFRSEIVPMFSSLGANDNTAQVRNQTTGTGRSQTVTSLRFDGQGIRISSFEVGTADRSRSGNGTGFIGFLDATYTTVASIVEADRTIAAANKILADDQADEQDKALALARKGEMVTYWGSGSSRARRPFHNWGGTTRSPNADGAVRFYATPVPCGRATIVDAHGREHQINVWQTGNRDAAATLAEETTQQVFTPVLAEGNPEEPF